MIYRMLFLKACPGSQGNGFSRGCIVQNFLPTLFIISHPGPRWGSSKPGESLTPLAVTECCPSTSSGRAHTYLHAQQKLLFRQKRGLGALAPSPCLCTRIGPGCRTSLSGKKGDPSKASPLSSLSPFFSASTFFYLCSFVPIPFLSPSLHSVLYFAFHTCEE